MNRSARVLTSTALSGDGTYDDTVPDWLIGKSIWEGNEPCRPGCVRAGTSCTTSSSCDYPHDTVKTLVIFRSTEQWFIVVDRPTRRDDRSLELAMDAGGRLLHPRVGTESNAGHAGVETGLVPVPSAGVGSDSAFVDAEGRVLLTPASVRAVAASSKPGIRRVVHRVRGRSSGRWDSADSGHPTDSTSLRSRRCTHLRCVVRPDRAAVVMRARGQGSADLSGGQRPAPRLVPASLHRARRDRVAAVSHAPHPRVHGRQGRPKCEVERNACRRRTLKDFGVDVCRWWVSSLPFENDIKVDLDFFKVAGEGYRKIRNTLRFLLGNSPTSTPPRTDFRSPRSKVRSTAGSCRSRPRSRRFDSLSRIPLPRCQSADLRLLQRR